MPAFLKPLFLLIKQVLKNWTRPTSFPATAASLADLTRTRTDLLIENALLRHQIVVLTRHSKRPPLTNSDRFVFILLARCTQFWEHAFVIVQPQTLLRWHRDLFRRYWKRKSKTIKRTPRIPQQTIDLIRQMPRDNCIIRVMPTIDSDGCRPPITEHVDHPFRRMASTFLKVPESVAALVRNQWTACSGI